MAPGHAVFGVYNSLEDQNIKWSLLKIAIQNWSTNIL
ncbi:MAG: hypothetical protein PWP08_1049 [Methanofollis sp.]|nr:hypothetical protein [Methanofollis sp.]